MTRGLKTAWRWRKAFWVRVAPGRWGGVIFVLLPGLFFLPLETVSVFGEQLRGVAILIWFFSLSLALALRTGPGLRDEVSVWPYQKGCSLGDLALEDWILDLVPLGLASIWWASMGVLAVVPTGSATALLWMAFFSLGLLTGALTHSLTLALSALGAQRPSDLTIFLAFLSMVLPGLPLEGLERLFDLANYLLPPFLGAVELHGAIRGGDGEGMVGPLLHVLLFSGFVLWVGLRRISAWRPRA